MKIPFGVVGLGFGGPDTPDAIEDYLYARLSDPMAPVFTGGPLARRLLARRVARSRAALLRERYAAIGGGSPAATYALAQVEGVVERLKAVRGERWRGYLALRYWHPLASDAVKRLKRDEVERAVLLPLMPHPSRATSGTCIAAFEAAAREAELPCRWTVVAPWHRHPAYLDAQAAAVREAAQKAESIVGDDVRVHVLLTARGLPRRAVAEGDAYLAATRETLRGLAERLPESLELELTHLPLFGRATGPGPRLTDRLLELAEQGAKAVVTASISSTYDDFETLWDLDIHHRDLALRHGIEAYVRARALNDSPEFVAALTQIVEAHLASPEAGWTRGR